jgi:predicted amino acid racemase
MFLEALVRRNAKLLEAAIELHARGEIPPATFVVDLEQVRANAIMLAREAKLAEIDLYFMSKQLGRNPVVAEAVSEVITAAVAVEFDEAVKLAEAGVRLGHMGHLVQIPTSLLGEALALRPEVITTFSYEKAVQLSDAAERLGIDQDLLLRVSGPTDHFYPGQEGGIPVDLVAREWERIGQLGNVRPVGVTSYPVFAYTDHGFSATPNMETLEAAAGQIGDLQQVNAPGHTSIAVLPLLRRSLATHAEPGHALTGTTPLAAGGNPAEVPACCMISEVSHLDVDRLWVFGGAFYSRGNCRNGIIRSSGRSRRLDVCDFPPDSIDYHHQLVRNGADASVGDPVVFSFRFQAFTSRAKVATVDGVASEEPVVVGLHDSHGNPVRSAQ